MIELVKEQQLHHILFIHSPADIHVSCFCLLAIINNAAVNIHAQTFMWTYVSMSFGRKPRSEIARSHYISMLDFWSTAKLFFKEVASFYMAISNGGGFQIFHALTNTCHALSFVLVILVSVKYCQIVDLVYISLITKDVEHFFTCLLGIHISSWRNTYSNPLPHFFGSFILLWLNYKRSLYNMDTIPLLNIWFAHIFSVVELSLHFVDDILRNTKVFNLDQVQLIYLIFYSL